MQQYFRKHFHMVDSLHAAASIFHNYQKFTTFNTFLKSKINNTKYKTAKYHKDYSTLVKKLFFLIISYVTYGWQYGNPRLIAAIARTSVF
jgi:hypothetical protein